MAQQVGDAQGGDVHRASGAVAGQPDDVLAEQGLGGRRVLGEVGRTGRTGVPLRRRGVEDPHHGIVHLLTGGDTGVDLGGLLRVTLRPAGHRGTAGQSRARLPQCVAQGVQRLIEGRGHVRPASFRGGTGGDGCFDRGRPFVTGSEEFRWRSRAPDLLQRRRRGSPRPPRRAPRCHRVIRIPVRGPRQ